VVSQAAGVREVVGPDQVVAQRLGQELGIGGHALAFGLFERDGDLAPVTLVSSRIGVDGPHRRDQHARGVAFGALQVDARAAAVAEVVGAPVADAVGSAQRAEVELRAAAHQHEATVARAASPEIIPFGRGSPGRAGASTGHARLMRTG